MNKPVKCYSRTLSVVIVHLTDCVIILLDGDNIEVDVLWTILLPGVDDSCLLWPQSGGHDHIFVHPLIRHCCLYSQVLSCILISFSPKVNLIDAISRKRSKGDTRLAA